MVCQSEATAELESLVRARTHYRVRDLRVAVQDDRIVLRGTATSFYVKQLAQEGILDVLPDAKLVNAIHVVS